MAEGGVSLHLRKLGPESSWKSRLFLHGTVTLPWWLTPCAQKPKQDSVEGHWLPHPSGPFSTPRASRPLPTLGLVVGALGAVSGGGTLPMNGEQPPPSARSGSFI